MPRSNKNDHVKPSPSNPMQLLTEDLLGMNQVPPVLQKRVNVSTVWRWANRGIKGVKLETIKLGGKTLTSQQALTRFIEQTTSN
ncbi:DUF1580 domain-containing protein [Rhodopirellula sp. SWK7]|uniref:DUF1580 domain-containing protein n=1 Tax=Rhodopirellula sp. SWK7 TaxID=595460 RepID=UPI0003486F8B|nr:DUF1580 domain-containing protein [Rhodopirellula sp. SWK7]